MEFKGTKTKWSLKKGTEDVYTKIFTGKDKVIEFQYNTKKWKIESYDALLISKAPEMLEMLEIILDCQCTENKLQSEFNKQIKQLIEEATKID